MDYFDNSSLVESIKAAGPVNQNGNSSTVKYLIAGIIIASSVAAIYFYKYQSLNKKEG